MVALVVWVVWVVALIPMAPVAPPAAWVVALTAPTPAALATSQVVVYFPNGWISGELADMDVGSKHGGFMEKAKEMMGKGDSNRGNNDNNNY